MTLTGTTTRYALLAELTGWLSINGYNDLLDVDLDGTVESDEQTTYGSAALNYACGLIDFAIGQQVRPEVAREAENIWLKDRCIDIAVWRLMGYGGRDVPDSVKVAYELTMKLLDEVKDGAKIPGYTYPAPRNADRVERNVRVVNVWGGD